MKNGKGTLVISIVCCLLLFAHFAAAYPKDDNEFRAKRMIKKTANVIVIAHRHVNEHRNYTGDLARAIQHQKVAVHLYHQGEYIRAMHQTKFARRLAVAAIRANSGSEPEEARFDAEEESITAQGPSEEEMRREAAATVPSEPVKDEAVLRLDVNKIKVDIDIR